MHKANRFFFVKDIIHDIFERYILTLETFLGKSSSRNEISLYELKILENVFYGTKILYEPIQIIKTNALIFHLELIEFVSKVGSGLFGISYTKKRKDKLRIDNVEVKKIKDWIKNIDFADSKKENKSKFQ